MKKLFVLFVVACLSVLVLAPAFASNYNPSTSPWGTSQDAGNYWGYEYIQTWLDGHGYGSVDAKNDYDLGDSSELYWAGGESTFQIQMELAGYANTNRLGYYQLDNSDQKTFTEIFSGTDGDGATDTFSINGPFGLALKTPEGKTWYTYRFFNSADQSSVKKAPQSLIYTLEPNKKWLVCWEDLNWACGDKDFQDHVVTVTATPEPISAGLFLLGGGVLAVIRRNKKGAGSL